MHLNEKSKNNDELSLSYETRCLNFIIKFGTKNINFYFYSLSQNIKKILFHTRIKRKYDRHYNPHVHCAGDAGTVSGL